MQFPNDFTFGYFARFYAWMTENPIWLANSARLLEDLPNAGASIRVLDLGAGPGNSALAMGGHHAQSAFIALDLSFPMLELIHRTRAEAGWPPHRLSPLQADAFRLPLADASVDAVTAHSFLYMLPHVDAALAEAYRVLRPGGVVAFLEPRAGMPDWGWLLRQPSFPFILSIVLWRIFSRLHRRFSSTALETALCRAGFHRVRTEDTLGNFGLFGRGQKP
jgi:ubiquinone/menaquinone biosynthesis C-methylase UbiE